MTKAKFNLYHQSKPFINFMNSYHAAKKKNTYFDILTKQIVKPEVENSYKFELFYFDIFSLCPTSKFGVLEVKREEEFGPVKNAPGSKEDSPETAA
jgi:UDP-N-acetylglucosamine/UDP-N-acetylgalactosamine diphosphorylase